KEAGRDALCAFEDASRIRTHAAARPFRRARRVPSRRHRSEPQDHGPAPARTTTQAGVGVSWVDSTSLHLSTEDPAAVLGDNRKTRQRSRRPPTPLISEFFDSIGP